MSTATKIEWTDATWNPTTGCTRVSAGCEHCYIERTPPMRANRRFEGSHIGASTKGGVQLHPDRLDQPLHWRKPRRVFVNSMSDLFHPDVPRAFIAAVFTVMAMCPEHQFQVLTKRPRRMRDLLNEEAFRRNIFVTGSRWLSRSTVQQLTSVVPERWPFPNVWLGTSVENQEWADKRIPLLLQMPAAVRFLSCEPLLGPIDLEGGSNTGAPWLYMTERIHWVIVGGESGPGARPMHPNWARSLRDQCVAAGVPFFFKQWGEWAPSRATYAGPSTPFAVAQPEGTIEHRVNGYTVDLLDELIWKVGKKAAGRDLGDRTWDEMPRV